MAVSQATGEKWYRICCTDNNSQLSYSDWMRVAVSSCSPIRVADTLLTHPPLPGGHSRVVTVSNQGEWNTAWTTAQPGDLIRQTANFNIDNFSIQIEANGTAANPICYDGNGFTITSTVSNPIGLKNASWLIFHDVHVNGSADAIWLFSTGARFPGDPSGPCNNIYIWGCEFHDADQELIKIGQCNTFEIIGCNLYRAGHRPWINGQFNRAGEFIYLGAGTGGPAFGSDNGLIENNWIHESVGGETQAGEAIDVKTGCENIIIRRNLCEDIMVASQGGITLAVDRQDTLDVNILCEENIVRRVYKATWAAGNDGQGGGIFDGNGIDVGSGSAIVQNNLVYDVERYGINVIQNFAGVNKRLEIKNNTVINCGDDCYNLAGGTLGLGAPLPPSPLIVCGNIDDDGTSGNYQATAADFVGPLNTEAGFELVAGSGAIDNGGCVTGSINGVPVQGASRDAGAFEFCP